jgi:hypothetical protein
MAGGVFDPPSFANPPGDLPAGSFLVHRYVSPRPYFELAQRVDTGSHRSRYGWTSTLIGVSHSPAHSQPARLFTVVTPHGAALLAVDGTDRVIAAARPIAAWALRRQLGEIAARYDVILVPDTPAGREPVPA